MKYVGTFSHEPELWLFTNCFNIKYVDLFSTDMFVRFVYLPKLSALLLSLLEHY
jgi:hypothetical protein